MGSSDGAMSLDEAVSLDEAMSLDKAVSREAVSRETREADDAILLRRDTHVRLRSHVRLGLAVRRGGRANLPPREGA